jgi:hypothetical protein
MVVALGKLAKEIGKHLQKLVAITLTEEAALAKALEDLQCELSVRLLPMRWHRQENPEEIYKVWT